MFVLDNLQHKYQQVHAIVQLWIVRRSNGIILAIFRPGQSVCADSFDLNEYVSISQSVGAHWSEQILCG